MNKAVEYGFFIIIDSVTESPILHLGATPLASHVYRTVLRVGISSLESFFLVSFESYGDKTPPYIP